METKSGTVQSTSPKYAGVNLTSEDHWYNYVANDMMSKQRAKELLEKMKEEGYGHFVEMQLAKDTKGKLGFSTIKILDKPAPDHKRKKPYQPTYKEQQTRKAMNRSVALKSAARVYEGKGKDSEDDVMRTAKKFENYLNTGNIETKYGTNVKEENFGGEGA